MNLTTDVAIEQVALTVPTDLNTDELRRRRAKKHVMGVTVWNS